MWDWCPVEYFLAYKVLRRPLLLPIAPTALYDRLIALYAVALFVGGVGKILYETLSAKISSPST